MGFLRRMLLRKWDLPISLVINAWNLLDVIQHSRHYQNFVSYFPDSHWTRQLDKNQSRGTKLLARHIRASSKPMQRYLDPTNDVGFKKVFGDKERLRDFLNCILRLPAGKQIKDIEFVPTETIPDLGQGKRSLFDLKCQDESGTYFLIEMQSQRTPGLMKRLQYYGAHAYVSQLESGQDHSALLPVVVITVLKKSIFPEPTEVITFHRVLEMKTQKNFLKDLSYVFVELEKFHKGEAELTSYEDEWLFFLKEADLISKTPTTLKDKMVLQAFQTMEMANWRPEEYDAYIRARLLLETEQLTGLERFEKGKAEGKAEANLEVAQKMQKEGMSLDLIASITGVALKKWILFSVVHQVFDYSAFNRSTIWS